MSYLESLDDRKIGYSHSPVLKKRFPHYTLLLSNTVHSQKSKALLVEVSYFFYIFPIFQAFHSVEPMLRLFKTAFSMNAYLLIFCQFLNKKM